MKLSDSFRSKAASRARSFAANKQGGVAIQFSLALIPLLGIVGAGVDYANVVTSQAKVQAAADAAVLAGAGDTSNTTTARTNTATNTFNAMIAQNFSGTIVSKTFQVSADKTKMIATVNFEQATTVGLLIKSKFTRTVTASAGITSVAVRALDVVMCIDSTGSMSNTLGAVKNNALNFKTNLDTELANRGVPPFDQMRVRVIFYKDYGGNGYNNLNSNYTRYYGKVTGTALGDAQPLRTSNFYTLPTDNTPFSNFVSPQSASGGGDLPESGIECLNEAMRSSWMQVNDTLSNGKKVEYVYPVIGIWTDAGAHPPNFANSVNNPNYPAASIMPRDYAGLLAKWNDPAVMDQTNKQIIFFGDPDKDDDYYYNLDSAWTQVKNWPGFTLGGSLTSANTNWIPALAAGIASGYKSPTLIN